MDEPYRYNGQFDVIEGAKFFRGGVLRFPIPAVPKRTERFYRTHYGYRVPHTGVIYRNNDHNLALALRRLTGCRRPDIPGEEERLQRNQAAHLTTMGIEFQQLQNMYSPYFLDYMGMRAEAAAHHADPHPKKELRVRAYKELVDSGQISARYWGRVIDGVLRVQGKLKLEEYAKPGKKPRMIVDLGVAASLQGFRLTEFLKTAQSAEPFYYNGGVIQFIKDPSPDTLRTVFKELISPSRRFYYCYFSDDACFSAHTPHGVFRANLDIASCDASHTAPLFERLVGLIPEHARDDMRVLVEQCRAALVVRSVENHRNKVVLRPRTPRLYSGATITTAINNLANISIAVAIARLPVINPESVRLAAERAGYIVTVDVAERIEQLQFLKHSPIKGNDGEWHPLLNLGVILRLSGTCRRDLPGKGDIRERARQFQSALLQGLCTGVTFPLLESMRAQCAGPVGEEFTVAVRRQLDMNYRVIASAHTSFTDSAVFSRYSDCPSFHDDLRAIGKIGFEQQVGNEAIATVLQADYGLSIDYGKYALWTPQPRVRLSASTLHTVE